MNLLSFRLRFKNWPADRSPQERIRLLVDTAKRGVSPLKGDTLLDELAKLDEAKRVKVVAYVLHGWMEKEKRAGEEERVLHGRSG